MRPQQQNRRMRGRGNGGGNNNRKGPNPLTRSYESNGPDVKIRGTAQQIAEKYTTLARDAQSSGDRVMAENYLQHAEHYNRLIAAAQAQQQQQQQQNFRENREDSDDELDEREDREEEMEAAGQHQNQQPQQQQPQNQQRNQPRSRINDGSGPQPVIEGVPAEVALKDRQLNGGEGKPNGQANGRSDRSRGSRPAANGQGEPSKTGEAHAEAEPTATKDTQPALPLSEAAPAAAEETAEAKPVKRTRRPRAKKADAEAPKAEEATTSS